MGVHDEETQSLAGAVLARGNPFEEGSNSRKAIANMFPPDHRDFLVKRLAAFLEPAFTASLSLAGRVLVDAVAPADIPQPPAPDGAADEELAPLSLATMEHKNAMISLLKGMHPAGTTWAHLAIAVGAGIGEARTAATDLGNAGLVRMSDDQVFASLAAMQDESIEALPWPNGTKIA